MIPKERFRELWKKYVEDAVVTDEDSPYFGMKHSEAIKSMPNTIKDECSPRLGDYLLDVANHTSLEVLAEKYPNFAHHTRDLKENGVFFIDSIPGLPKL